jgi:outer membrane lipoprotein carrier protein
MCGYVAALVLLLFALTDGIDPKANVARFEARYRPAKTLQASFLERYTENGRLVRVEAGTASFRRPGKMRWDYRAPENNLFLVDGKNAWFYVPADHTVTRVPAKQSADWRTPLALLVGDMKVSRVCEKVTAAADEKPENAGDAMLDCALRGAGYPSPKGASEASPSSKSQNSEAVFLEIDTKTGDLVRVLIREPGGIEIEFQFTNWQMDLPMPDSLFRFDPPKGVAIVNGELPLGNTPVKH